MLVMQAFAIAALLLLLAATSVAGAEADRSAAQAKIVPRSLAPLEVRGTGFKRFERVRVTVTPVGGAAVTERLRARRKGTFTATFAGIDACNGIEAVAEGRRGSRASFQLAAIGCTGF
jgi:hypothetical protein